MLHAVGPLFEYFETALYSGNVQVLQVVEARIGPFTSLFWKKIDPLGVVLGKSTIN